MRRLFIRAFVMFTFAGITACQGPRDISPSSVVRANANAVRLLGLFKPVERTTYLMASINSPRKGESWIKGSYEGSNTHNYVFFNTTDESTRILLPTNDYLITSTLSFPEKSQDTREGSLTQWYLYFLVKADTDGDKELTYRDKRTVAISDAGGVGYTEVIDNVEEVFGQSMRDMNTMIVIYRSDSKKYVARIDLPSRKLLAVTELPWLGNDVQ